MSTAGRRRRRRAGIVLTILFFALLVGGLLALAYLQGWLWGTDDGPGTGGPTPSDEQTTTAPPVLPDAADITVNVYNTTQRSGLAGRTGEAVGALGFQVGEVGNEPNNETAEGIGEIRFGPAGTDAAQVVLQDLAPDAELVEIDREGATIDLLLGPDFVELEAAGDEGDGG